MQVFLLFAAAVCAYLIGGVNPAIILSKLIYRKDIRECGSGNPGFTNFKRVFGNRYAWYVLALDILKSVLPSAFFGWAFGCVSGMHQFGAAYTGFFAMLGHAYPVWYGFQGGKGFLVGAGAIFLIDWRAGLIALAVMLLLLFTVKYMSVATVAAAISTPVSLAILGVESPWVLVFNILSVALMTFRHKENFKRLKAGTETKFSLKDKAK